MKSARVLTPILVLVLVFCMLALTFAWFSMSVQTESVSVLRVGTYIKVTFDDEGLLNAEKYNGQKGYMDDGTPYTDDDKAYEAYYHTSLKLQGGADLYLRMYFSDLLISVSDRFYRLTAEQTLAGIVSEFEGYDPSASHVGKAETVTTENGEELLLTDPADDSEPFVYTDDGTVNGKVLYIRLDKANVDKYFTLSYARITATTEPYAYGDFVAQGEGLEYIYGTAADAEVTDDASSYGRSNPICIKIVYSNAAYARPFPFSGEEFKASSFRFGVLAEANYD